MSDLVVQGRLLQRTLLERYIEGVSIATLCEKYGLEDRQIIATIKHLLAQEDVFDEMENRKMAVYKLKSLLAKAEMFLDMTDIKTAPGLLKEAHSLIRSISELQEKQKAISEEEAKQLAFQQAALLVQVVQASFDVAKDKLRELYPVVDIDLIDLTFQEGVKEIAASYSA